MKTKIGIDYEKGKTYFRGIDVVIGNRYRFSTREMEELESVMGEAARGIFYRTSKESFLEFWLGLKKDFSGSNKEVIYKLLDLFPKLGYGNPKIENFSEERGKFKVSIENSFGALNRRGEEKTVCYVPAGILNSLFEVVLGEKMETKEEKCVAKGDDSCEFTSERKTGKIPPHKKAKNQEPDNLQKINFELKENGEIFRRGISQIIFPREHKAIMVKKYENAIGREAAHGLLYKIHKKAAIRATRDEIRRNFPLRLSLKFPFVKKYVTKLAVEKMYPERGFGAIKTKKSYSSKYYCKYEVKNSFIGSYFKKREELVCSFISGNLAGIMEVAKKKEMNCDEVNCSAQGNPSCIFEVKSKKKS